MAEAYAVDQNVWVPNKELVWVRARVVSIDAAAQQLVVQMVADEVNSQPGPLAASCTRRTVAFSEAYAAAADSEQPVEDMIDLPHLHEPGVLSNLAARYSAGCPYTSTGGILIALNPFERLPGLYGEQHVVRHAAAATAPPGSVPRPPPHAYGVAAAAYAALVSEGTGQAILVTGESGAGKTETAKLLLAQLAHMGGGGGQGVEARLLGSTPLLEAFGNAATRRNANSSRFGKFMELRFDGCGRVAGASIRTFLLEVSRLGGPAPGERAFHAFYQLCAGASAEQRATWRLRSAGSFALLASGTVELPGVDDAAGFSTTCDAMAALGISPAAQQRVWALLAAMLHLADMRWSDEDCGGGSSSQRGIDDGPLSAEAAEAMAAASAAGGCPLEPTSCCAEALIAAATLLGVTPGALAGAIGSRTRVTPEGPITSALSPGGAAASRDALLKALYAGLFDWLVSAANNALRTDHTGPQQCDQVKEGGGAAAAGGGGGAGAGGAAGGGVIGLLDIYGFECFDANDLEQLCINHANERLQQQFNEHVFKAEQAEYEREGISWSHISFSDNADMLELLEGRLGLVDLLDEATRFGDATPRDLGAKLFSAPSLSGTARFGRTPRDPDAFTLHHYAGPVSYQLANMLERNRHAVVPEHTQLLASAACCCPLLAAMVAVPPAAAAPPMPGQRQRSLGGRGGGAHGYQHMSVCVAFTRQLGELMATLRALSPWFVRCIKPNAAGIPGQLDAAYTLEQLRCGGVMEAVRISTEGYPWRRSHAELLRRYWQLRPALLPVALAADGTAVAEACCALLGGAGLQEGADWQLGTGKVFLRGPAAARLAATHARALAAAATRIQAAARGVMARRLANARRAAAVTLQAGVRGMFARQRAACLLRERAATVLQTAWRGVASVMALRAVRSAAIVLQAAARSAAVRSSYQAARAERRCTAATRIQAAWRGTAEVRRAARDRAAVIGLQAAVRGAATRRTLAPELLRHRAATTIQRAWRGAAARAAAVHYPWRTDPVAAAVAAVVIQTAWRQRHQIARDARRARLADALQRYACLHRAAVRLQGAWRCRAACAAASAARVAASRARFRRQAAALEAQLLVASRPASAHTASSCSSASKDVPPLVGAAAGRGRSQTSTAMQTLGRHAPPQHVASYGVCYAGVNGDRAAAGACTDSGRSTQQQQGAPRPGARKLRLFAPPPPAGYGVSFAGLQPGGHGGGAPPATIIMKPAADKAPLCGESGSSGNSDYSSAANNCSGDDDAAAVLVDGHLQLSPSAGSTGVVKSDGSAELPPQQRLLLRLGSLAEERGRVASLASSWLDRVAAQ